MSYQLLTADVLFYQRFLKAAGFYNHGLDGVWGTHTNNADKAFVAETNSIKQQYGSFDARSETNIITLLPKAQIAARTFLSFSTNPNFEVRIISGTRTYAEQDALYKKGRYGNPPPIVTNAKGGRSNHNFGIAWDIGLFDKHGTYNTKDANYIIIANLILPHVTNVEWGGNWHSFIDYPHFQLKPTTPSIATIRQLFETGGAYV